MTEDQAKSVSDLIESTNWNKAFQAGYDCSVEQHRAGGGREKEVIEYSINELERMLSAKLQWIAYNAGQIEALRHQLTKLAGESS